MVIKSGGVIRDISRCLLKSKSGQVTVFIIIGILMLVIMAGTLYFTQVFTKQDIFAAEDPIIAEVPSEFKPLQLYTDSCLDSVGKKALIILGEQGGYIYPDLVGEYSASNPTEADGIDLEPVKVPYWHYNVNPNNANQVAFSSLRPELKYEDSIDFSIEAQLSRYVEEKLDECLINYKPFEVQGFDVEILDKHTKEVIVVVSEESVNFWLKMKVKANKAESEHIMEEFYVKIPLRLKHYYEVASSISAAQHNHSFMETLALELIELYGHPDITKLPPTTAVTFEPVSVVSWTDGDVKRKVKSLLTSYVPMFRHLSSKDYFRYEYPESDFSPLYQKTYDNMIIPLENADNVEISFDYFGWEPFVDVNEGEEEIAPAEYFMKSPLGVIPFAFNFQRYQNTYDISYPMLVTVRDPDAFAGEGYTFSFALEGTVINNRISEEDYIEPELTIANRETMVCDKEKMNTEVIKTIVVDSYTKEPLEFVKIGFTIPEQDSCVMGITDDEGMLETNYPAVYGGVVEFLKDNYLTDYYAIDTYQFKEEPGIIGYATQNLPPRVIEKYETNRVVNLHRFVEVNVTAKKKEINKCVQVKKGKTHCFFNQGSELFEPDVGDPILTYNAKSSISKKHEYFFVDSPKDIQEGETLIYNLERVADLDSRTISDEYATTFSVTAENPVVTVQLVPGVYSVTAVLTSNNEFIIPTDKRCGGSGAYEQCVSVPELNLPKFISGSMNLDTENTFIVIRPEQLYSTKEIEFQMISYDMAKLPEKSYDDVIDEEFNVLVIEDQGVIANMTDIVVKPYVREALEPIYR